MSNKSVIILNAIKDKRKLLDERIIGLTRDIERMVELLEQNPENKKQDLEYLLDITMAIRIYLEEY